MDNDYLYRLVTSENNDFSNNRDESFIFFFHSNIGGTTTYDVERDIAQNIEVGSFYKGKKQNIYQVLGKQYDHYNNIILLCKEI